MTAWFFYAPLLFSQGAASAASAGQEAVPPIARDMQVDAVDIAPRGGGDLNGTAAASILFSHAGTAAEKIALPRKPGFSGNYTGVV